MPEEIYMQSSSVLRTIQSGYSELMGMYPPGPDCGAEQLKQEHIDSFTTGKARPPFKVRDYDVINEDLGFSALPNDFVTEPIWVRMGYDIHDDIRTHGCHFIKSSNRDRLKDTDMWLAYQPMKDATKEAFAKALNYSVEYIDKMSFLRYCTHADTIVAADYEGSLNHEDFFNEEQWSYTKSF